MKKIIAMTAATMLVASTAFAGSPIYVAPPVDPMVVPVDEPMGSSGAWIVPLIAIGLIAIAISQDSNQD